MMCEISHPPFSRRIAHFAGAGLVFWQIPEVQSYMAVDLKW